MLQVPQSPRSPMHDYPGRPVLGLHACVLSCFSPVRLFAAPWTVARQAPLSMGFSRQEYWSGLSCPSTGDPPYPGIKSASPASSASAGGFFTTTPPGKPILDLQSFGLSLDKASSNDAHLYQFPRKNVLRTACTIYGHCPKSLPLKFASKFPGV